MTDMLRLMCTCFSTLYSYFFFEAYDKHKSCVYPKAGCKNSKESITNSATTIVGYALQATTVWTSRVLQAVTCCNQQVRPVPCARIIIFQSQKSSDPVIIRASFCMSLISCNLQLAPAICDQQHCYCLLMSNLLA